ncbi:MAG TPA: NAD-dependent deacylase [Candidatus Poseidoniales archaeon]|nr:NAD-dependent deacylase [Candidatus Poseidoniales archaeon]
MDIVVLTGAGISAESGLRTFRDSGGLWENHRIEDVATYSAWASHPEMVWRFYQARRRQLLEVQPNPAHHALHQLEIIQNSGHFTLITQNVDNLHERAGSSNLIHMHGELCRLRCEKCEYIAEMMAPEHLQEAFVCCPECKCERMRPHIVWFGEMPLQMHLIDAAVRSADLFLVIGSSGHVYPAAGLLDIASSYGARCVGINLEPPQNVGLFDEFLQGKAGDLLPEYVSSLQKMMEE